MDDVRQLLATALTRRNGIRFALAFALGLREGDALGLQWRDVGLRRDLVGQLEDLAWCNELIPKRNSRRP